MSKFDENLFGRIAILRDYLTKEELEKCLEVQRESISPKSIGQILLEEGYLNEEQLDRILDIRNKKVRKFLRRHEDSAEVDKEIGRLLLQKGMLDLDVLEGAVLEQQRLRGLNLHFSLVEVLVSRGDIAPQRILDILAERDWRMKLCPVCDAHYQIVNFLEDEEYVCPRCQSPLVGPAFLDTVMVDGVLGSEEFEQII